MPEIPHPRMARMLIGHNEPARALQQAIESGKMHHAWLFSGPKGVGKATLAYRAARFIICGGVEKEPEGLFGDALPSAGGPLHTDDEHPAVQRLVNDAHADLKVIEPTSLDEDGKEKAGLEIRIHQIRKLQHFLGQTSAESGRRVVIIDAVEDMNRNAANALLKMLEEPPKQTVFFLITHASGRLLPTIRSRCRSLSLQPLAAGEVRQVLASLGFNKEQDEEMEFAVHLADGAPGSAVRLYRQDALSHYRSLVKTLEGLPRLDIVALHELAQGYAGKKQEEGWEMAVEMLRWLLSEAVKEKAAEQSRRSFAQDRALRETLKTHYGVDRLVELWETLAVMQRDKEVWNLDPAFTLQQMVAQLEKAE